MKCYSMQGDRWSQINTRERTCWLGEWLSLDNCSVRSGKSAGPIAKFARHGRTKIALRWAIMSESVRRVSITWTFVDWKMSKSWSIPTLPIKTKQAILAIDVVAMEVSLAECWQLFSPQGWRIALRNSWRTAETQGTDRAAVGAWGVSIWKKSRSRGWLLSWWRFFESFGGGRTSAVLRQRRMSPSHQNEYRPGERKRPRLR